MLISDSSSDVCSFDLANFDNAFRTVQREEVGIKLEVTPQVNAAGEVKMFIRQEVSSVAGPVSSRNSDLILNKRSFETVLTVDRSEEHTSELQSLMRISYAVFCLKKKNKKQKINKQ